MSERKDMFVAEAEPEVEEILKKAVVARVQWLIVRTEQNGEEIGRLELGTEVGVVEIDGPWSIVRANGMEGWVKTTYLDFI